MSAVNDLSDSFHIESHASLLQQPVDAVMARKSVDAIVVPTTRPWLLRPAAVLARDIGCAFVVLCSTPEQAEHAMSRYGSTSTELLMTFVPQSIEEGLLSFLTSRRLDTDMEPSCHADIARKRNIGLLLARLCGWRTIMYLDDDIRGLTVGAVSRAADLTACFQVAGFRISDYPDNSVVCHAYRLAGGNQDVFPGGSALLLDVARYSMLFPPIYNEDWLFLFDAVQARSVVAAGSLSQLEYKPFDYSNRADSQEFGDVIAEGLYRLIHEGVGLADATSEYWQDVLSRRSRLIDHVAARLSRTKEDTSQVRCALTSLAAARKRLTAISPVACLSFIRAWQADRDIWQNRLDTLPVVGDLSSAAEFLRLPARIVA
jgi:hypothetical protein